MSIHEQLDDFHFLATMNSGLVIMHVQILVWDAVFIILDVFQDKGLLGLRITCNF